MCAFHLTRTDRVSKFFELIVVQCILKSAQITDKPAKTVVGFGRVPGLKLIHDFFQMAFADFPLSGSESSLKDSIVSVCLLIASASFRISFVSAGVDIFCSMSCGESGLFCSPSRLRAIPFPNTTPFDSGTAIALPACDQFQ